MTRLLTLLSLAPVALAPIVRAQSSCQDPAGATLVADVNSGQDTIYPAVPIGFPFPLNGTTYTDIHLSDHLFAFLSNGGVPAVPGGGPITYNVQLTDFIGNGPCISPFWSDTTMGTSGTLTVTSSPLQFTATWTNVETFFQVPPAFTVQMHLFPSGEIRFLYDASVNNYGSSFAPNAIVGVTPGIPSMLPAASDLSMPVATTDPTVFENFATPSTFDLTNNGLSFLPTSPGWVVVPLGPPTACAQAIDYGQGCTDQFASFYELFASAGAFDLNNSALSLLSTGSGYIVIPGGSYQPVGSLGTATALALTDDSQVAAGTLGLTVGSNGWIAIGGGNSNGFTPDVATFLTNPQTAFCCWHDYNPTTPGSGQVMYEEAGSLAQITFAGVYNYGGSSPADANFLQFQYDASNGNVVIAWQTMSANGNAFLVGYSPGGTNIDPGSTDLSALVSLQTFTAERRALALTSTAPHFGANWALTTTNIDPISPIAITFFGDGQIPLPGGLPLSSIGLPAPGCSVWINQVLGNITSLNASGTTAVAFPIPSNTSLAGAILTAQSLCLTTANAANLLTSNGTQGTIGN